jgi:ligand-binding sensor domain-containing protein
MELFAQATKQRLRFKSNKVAGNLSVEDLWRLDLDPLNHLAVELVKELESQQISFIDDVKTDKVTQLKFDVVKYIIDFRKQELANRQLAQETATYKQQLMELRYQKEKEQMQQMSIAEIDKKLAELE